MENEKLLKNAELYALNYLSYRSRTEKEVLDKLRLCGKFDEETIRATISMLKKQGYIDDAKFALLFADSKSRNKLDGKRKIKQMLYQKGIDSDTAQAAFAALEEAGELNEEASALKLISKKTKGATNLEREQKNKIFAYLARKGYSISSIKKAFAAYEGMEACNDGFDPDYEANMEQWD